MTRNETQKKLTPKQSRVLEALLAGAPTEEAAVRVGVTRRTVERWRELPQFRDEAQRRAAESLRDASAKLAHAAGDAVDVMVAIMHDVQNSAGVRLRAANFLLDASLKLHTLIDQEERIQEALARLDALEGRKL